MANGRYAGVRSGEGYRLEHVIIAERALGKALPIGAIVHHHDGSKMNNVNANLVICQDRGYHAHIHKRMRILAAGYSPDTHLNCPTCGQIKLKTEFHRNSSSYIGLNNERKSCVLAKSARRAARLRSGRTARIYRKRVVVEEL